MKFEELKNNEKLLKKVIRIAQHESELDLGVNPANFEQANTQALSEKDFEYIKRICDLAEKKLTNEDWLSKTLNNIEQNSIFTRRSKNRIRFDDELFKVGRGILESFLKEKYS